MKKHWLLPCALMILSNPVLAETEQADTGITIRVENRTTSPQTGALSRFDAVQVIYPGPGHWPDMTLAVEDISAGKKMDFHFKDAKAYNEIAPNILANETAEMRLAINGGNSAYSRICMLRVNPSHDFSSLTGSTIKTGIKSISLENHWYQPSYAKNVGGEDEVLQNRYACEGSYQEDGSYLLLIKDRVKA